MSRFLCVVVIPIAGGLSIGRGLAEHRPWLIVVGAAAVLLGLAIRVHHYRKDWPR